MNTIFKITFLISISIFLFSCESAEKENPVVQIETYQKQVRDLNKKIEKLESSVSNAETNEYNGLKVSVQTEKLKLQSFSHFFVATGEMETVEEAFISPEVGGQIVAIYVKEGEKVNKGEVLAKLSTAVLEKSIQEVQSQLNLAEIVFKKQSALWEKQIGSEIQYLEAKNAYEGLQNKLETLRAQYNLAVIESPIDGVVEKIILKQGEMASPGMQFMQVVNMDQLYLTAQLSESHLPIIKKGDVVNITIPSIPGFELSKPVYRTGNVINKQNRTFEVQILLENPTGEMKPNMLANIEINDYNHDQAIVVPSILIKKDLNGSFIYMVATRDGNKVAQKVYITSGRSYEDKTEVVSGLKSGDVIITSGYNNVSDGAVLNIING